MGMPKEYAIDMSKLGGATHCKIDTVIFLVPRFEEGLYLVGGASKVW